VVHLGLAVVCTSVWAYTRKGERSLEVIGHLDALGSTAVFVAIGGMLVGLPAASRPELEFLLIFNVCLVARAAIVPSTPLRTLVIGAFGAIFVLVGSTWIHLHAASLGVGAPVFNPVNVEPLSVTDVAMPPPAVIAIVCFAWGTVSVSLTVLISKVIYGLQKKIEEVAQLGQYRLDEKIGEGGMGIVYRASHAMLRRPTAIKLLHSAKAGQGALARFEREVQNTAKLTHPNTVAIYDYGRTPDGLFYYAMEYLDGLDLEKLVEIDGPQSSARVVHILRQVAGALAEAHRAGLIHRDIKPANVILCERGGVSDFAKVVDFGLVKDVSGGSPTATSAGNVITGTPLYMSPESIVSPDTIDGRSDLYALGAVAYFLVTGAPVFDAPTLLEVCARHLHGEVEPPSKRTARPVPPALEALILSCLEKQPDRRPASAEALHDALLALDLPGWTARDANDWWTTHGDAMRARRSGTRTPSPFGKTVGVDLARRDTAA
jgi:eukaryotic-like serine/threonine-protein kinase